MLSCEQTWNMHVQTAHKAAKTIQYPYIILHFSYCYSTMVYSTSLQKTFVGTETNLAILQEWLPSSSPLVHWLQTPENGQNSRIRIWDQRWWFQIALTSPLAALEWTTWICSFPAKRTEANNGEVPQSSRATHQPYFYVIDYSLSVQEK